MVTVGFLYLGNRTVSPRKATEATTEKSGGEDSSARSGRHAVIAASKRHLLATVKAGKKISHPTRAPRGSTG